MSNPLAQDLVKEKTTQHHCNVCGTAPNARCVKLGHSYLCKKHNCLSRANTSCLLCKREQERLEKEEREASLEARGFLTKQQQKRRDAAKKIEEDRRKQEEAGKNKKDSRAAGLAKKKSKYA